jgi:hypothetical protein
MPEVALAPPLKRLLFYKKGLLVSASLENIIF